MLLDFIEKNIEVEITGGIVHRGILIDSGLDVLVLYHECTHTFLYIPFVQIQRVKEISFIEEDTCFGTPSEKPIEIEAISYRKILLNARGLFVKAYVTGNKTINGYLTSIMNDYFEFYSPAYKTVFISMNHLKWLIPYPANTTPYKLDSRNVLLKHRSSPLARRFDDQLKKLENQLVILDDGDHPDKIGLLEKVQDNQATLITDEGEIVVWNLEHIKTIQLPN
ncbi:DUF2642 domain-containing protein [Bacillus salipaludis]|uniref:DUF2642 domain-containing protein n=1 Tax=Bacillus salipaludis TaxID=2547811 RepID=A0AA90ZAX1_9BACI|nr:DUF2642 domain-containing protein [Bacillus salipaludis]MDQ6601046.1 DUF2642 domain-containing protein [Bacillus salipaludis]